MDSFKWLTIFLFLEKTNTQKSVEGAEGVCVSMQVGGRGVCEGGGEDFLVIIIVRRLMFITYNPNVSWRFS